VWLARDSLASLQPPPLLPNTFTPNSYTTAASTHAPQPTHCTTPSVSCATQTEITPAPGHLVGAVWVTSARLAGWPSPFDR
jgi:hypothetical protein